MFCNVARVGTFTYGPAGSTITLLEFGVLPIKQEVHLRKLNFLYHILTCDENDPVKVVYNEQGRYKFEENWHNEVNKLRLEYSVEESDDDIKGLSKDAWKRLVEKRVTATALRLLNESCNSQSKTSNLPLFVKLKQQAYFNHLRSDDARNIFKARTGVLDIKSLRQYQYDNERCRLCDGIKEDLQHVVNE